MDLTTISSKLSEARLLIWRDGWDARSRAVGSRNVTAALNDAGLAPATQEGTFARTLVLKEVSRRFTPCMTVTHLWGWEAKETTTKEDIITVLDHCAEIVMRRAAS